MLFHRPWFLLLALLAGCGLPDVAVAPTQAVPGTEQPRNFPAMRYALAGNPPDAATFALGRRLFYDPRLSSDSTVSCGSCHQQFAAFAHAGHRLSHGVGNQLGSRNAPALQNLRWKQSLLWDGGASNLETMPLAPLTDPREMGETLPHLLAKLNRDAGYRQQFAAIYGPGAIDSYRFLRALAQFTASFTSANSRYDHYVRGEPDGVLDAAERRGLALLRQHCQPCHATDLFSDGSFRNNGLDRRFPLDSGRAHITRDGRDAGRFAVPSLRNVALTAPYMHDGRFATLPQAVAHYAGGVLPSPTLDPALRQPDGSLGLTLSAAEQADLVAFLNTLTDAAFIHDARLAEQR